MRLLDRYITTAIVKTFISTVLVFCFMYILIDITSQLDEFIDRKVPIEVLLKYYLSFFPVIIVQTSSFACLIAVLFTFSNLNTHNEIVAMRASGLSFWRITKPAIFFGLIISFVMFWMNERFVPESNLATKEIRNEHMILEVDRLKKKKEKIHNLTFYGMKNRLYFVDSFIPSTTELEGITIIEYDNQSIKQKIVALRGQHSDV